MGDSDNFFGPKLPNVFDFTLVFEQGILSLLPTCLFLCLAPFRMRYLLRKETVVGSSRLLWSKLTLVAVFFSLQIALVVLWSLPSTTKLKTSIAEVAIGVLEALVIAAVSYTEHKKSARPSALLNSYLFLSIFLDIALSRTLCIRPGLKAIAGVFIVSLVTKAVILGFEELPKRLLASDKDLARETTAGLISRSLFCWLNSMFFTGSKSLLGVEDLGAIEAKFNSRALMNQLERTWETDPKTSKFSLMKCTFLAYKWQFATGIVPRLLFSGFTFAQPFLINTIVDFVGEPDEKKSEDISGGLIGATVLVYIGLAVSNAWYKHLTFQLVTMYRGGLASLVFKKTLVLHPAATKDSAPVTLMSTDVESIVVACYAIHDIWGSFVELPIAIYLLYRQVGVPSLFILVPAVLTTIAGGIISPALGPARVKWNQAIQKRISATSGMLNQMKGIKMMGLTDFFHNMLQGLRVKELKLSVKFRLILVQLNVLAFISEEITPVVIIVAAIFWTKASEGLSIAEAFTSLSIISIASAPLVMILISIMQLFGAIGSFTRIQEFLLLEERKDPRELPRMSLSSSREPKAEWDNSVNLDPKSSAGDAEIGFLSRNTTCSSIFDGSINAVTIEEASFYATKELEVLHDISFKAPHKTLSMIVGKVGCGKSSFLKAIAGELTMSKGRMLVNTNHTAYCAQTPWLQNISIQDNIIGQSTLDQTWLATVIRACSLDKDISLFPFGDMTIVGSGGVVLSGGQRQRVLITPPALARAVYSRRSLLILDDVFSGLDSITSKTIFHRLFGTEGLMRRLKATVIMATNDINFLPAADYITMLDDGNIIRNQVFYDSIQPSAWGVLKSDSEFSSTAPDNEDDEHPEKTEKISKTTVSPKLPKTDAELSRRTGDFDCYKIYFQSMSSGVIIIILLSIVGHVGVQKMPQIWLRLWTQKGTGAADLSYMGGYIAFAISSLVIGTLSLAYFLIVAVPRSANYLHQMLLTSVVQAPLNFFTSTDIGITLNRFSQDMTLIDNALPMAFWTTAYCFGKATADIAVIATGASYVGAIIPVCIIALYFIQKYYLLTSRQVRFLDLETKSPLYTQFTETLAGISTIRSFGWSNAFLVENHLRLDMSQKPFYMMFCIQRWLQVVLDLFIAGIALVLVAIALKLPETTSKGAIGLAMVNLIGFNPVLTAALDQWTKLETSLGAIARLKWFMSNTVNENREAEKEEPPADWPVRGAIELENVSASYNGKTEPVLHNISLKIQPGQKIGLCGRSGSGKSSLILTLSRLLELHSGSIFIDNIDLSTIPRQTIRSRITALPQEAIKFSGTVRYNLDPECAIQANEPLVSVLRKTAIWPAIESRGGLDADMDELGFSVGQLQLFCLARALLDPCSIVLLDEATSSVDLCTNEEIRRVIRQEMAGRTVVEVAHRLEAMRECDVVVVMAEGKILEQGNPEKLLSSPSAFRALWESQGMRLELN